MTEGNDDDRLRTARWLVVAAFGLAALLMGTVAFAAVALPGQNATYADLPVVHVASTTTNPAASVATEVSSAGQDTSLSPSATHPATSAPAPAHRAPALKAASARATTPSKGNTTKKKKRASARKREVVAPDVREESGDHVGEDSSEH